MMQSLALPSFWKAYYQLPEKVQKLADKQYDLFSKNPFHPSLDFLKKGEVWTVEIDYHYRAIGRKKEIVFIGFGSVLTNPITNSCDNCKKRSPISNAGM